MRSALFAANPSLGREPACSWVLTLHSSVPPDEQRLAFQHPPTGVRKVLLATNIAETSITIDDVGVVIDTAHMKELRYDVDKRVASLEDTMISRATAKQRRGRAGRVAPGTCVHLITKYCHDRILEPHQQAEIFRVPLEELVLRIHAVGLHKNSGGSAANACAKLIEPPHKVAVRHSVEELVYLGALSIDATRGCESLSRLGAHLAKLPLDVRVGKLVLLSLPFGAAVMDMVLTVAAALTVGSPFASPFERRYLANRVHRDFGERIAEGGLSCSDVLAVVQAFNEWEACEYRDRNGFCHERFLRSSTMHDIFRLKKDLYESLHHANLSLPKFHREVNRSRRQGRKKAHTTSTSIITALLCTGVFPQIAVVKPKRTFLAEIDGSAPCGPVDIHVQEHRHAAAPCAVQIHPSSLSTREKLFGTPYLLYCKLVRTQRLYLRDVTPVAPLVLAIFAGSLSCGAKLHVTKGKTGIDILYITDQIQLALPRITCNRILDLRAHLDKIWRKALEIPASHHSRNGGDANEDLLSSEAVCCLQDLFLLPASCVDFLNSDT